MHDTIKQDINFLENPMWMQETKKATGQVVKWADTDGYVFEAAGGVPSKVDMIILYFFMLEAQNNNWNDTLVLTRYQVLNGCGMSIGKDQRDRLKKSLEIWKRVTVSFSGTFYSGKEYHHMEFGVIDEWKARKKDNKLEIRLNRSWVEKIKQSEFFKYISFTQMKALRSPLALRLYELLIKTFYQRDSWEIDILKLAAKIPMVEKYPAHIIPKITAATKRIHEKTELSVLVEVVKQGRGKGKFIFTRQTKRQPRQQELFSEKPQTQSLSSIPNDIINMIPIADRGGCIDLCNNILVRDGIDGLKFYLNKTNSRKKTDAGNYSGYLKTISGLNLYGDYLAVKQEMEAKAKAEQRAIDKQGKKDQKKIQDQEKERARREALDKLKTDDPGQYADLREQAAVDLGIDLGKFKRGERLKIDYAVMNLMP